jgi:multiple sugar transport system substrate-binding protein
MLELYHDKAAWVPNVDKVGTSVQQALGIGFKSVPYPDTTTYQSTVRGAISTESAPDLFSWWSGYRMEDIVKAGAAEDVSALWQQQIASGAYSQDIADAFTFDGKIYAVPFLISYWTVLYNKPVFTQNNLQPPTTWDEFMALCATLKEQGITPLAQSIDGRWPAFIMFQELVLRAAGPEFYNSLMRGEASYEDPKVVAVMERWKELIDNGYFTDPGVTFGTADNSLLPLFSQGQVGMVPIGDWYSAILVGGGLKPGEDYDAFILPNIDPALPKALFFETSPLIVSARGARKAEAIKVAEWWMSAEAQKEWSDLQGFSSPNSKVAINNPVANAIATKISSEQYQLVQRYWEATPPEIVEPAVDELGRFILNPTSYREVLAAMQQTAQSIWQSRA